MIKIPATTANLGSGFDILGIALNLYNYFEFKESDRNNLIIKNNTNRDILLDSEDNLIHFSIKKIFDEFGKKAPPLEISMEINIPFSRGLGSSSSAICGGLYIANKLLNNHFSKNDLVKFATDIEGHPDNVAPCLLGGIVLSSYYDKKVLAKQIELNSKLKFIVAIPNFELSTKKARSVLPKRVNFQDSLFNLSRVSFLIQGFCNNDLESIAYGLNDKLHEPYRAKLIKGFNEVKKSAIDSGAIGAVLSGAGPCILAIANNNYDKIANIMKETWANFQVDSVIKILEIDYKGIE
ncbi:MAG: homoserine kinase [Candidatus Sericytochromatia bacterium]